MHDGFQTKDRLIEGERPGSRTNDPKTAEYEHHKTTVTGSYHRILLTNEAYRKDYISYGEWHKRLEKEIALVQAYRAARPSTQDLPQLTKNPISPNVDQLVLPDDEAAFKDSPAIGQHWSHEVHLSLFAFKWP